ncbi:MAG: DUF559 domain-containing protein [Flavobacterium sp.]|nr:DUF559 domain-containing protein [Flavobacterium sp.]MDP3680060.1 DUF559 domain-containing protein [Flavobacterium sp.]
MQRDKEVNLYLISYGWVVLRFWSAEIRENIEAVIISTEKQISLQLKKKK